MKQALVAGLPTTGHYVVLASGDLRSAVLLHQLLNQPGQQLRLRLACPDSASSRAQTLVRDQAQAHDLPYHQAATHQLPELVKRQRARGVITANPDLRLDGVTVIYALGDLDHEAAQDYSKLHGLVWLRGASDEVEDPIDLRRRELEQRQRQIDADLDRRLAKSYYQFRSVDGIRLPRPWVAQATWQQLESLMAYSLRKLAPVADWRAPQIQELVMVAKTAPAGHVRPLSGSLIIRVEYDTVAIVLADSATPPLPVMTLAPQTSVSFGRWRLSYGSHRPSSHNSVRLDPGEYRVRCLRPGDSMTTAEGRQKLQDIFTDRKIDRHHRSSWPIICDSHNTILWLPGLAQDPQVLSESPNGYTLIAEEV